MSIAASGMSLELCFWHNFSGVKRSCWTTGRWRSCLSLEVVSSIPIGSTIIYRLLCGLICVSLCQSIKIKPTNMYIASVSVQFKINTHTRVEIDTCQTGCQLSSASSGMSLELCFWHNFSGVKRSCWTTGSWRSCLSLEVVSSIPIGSTIIYRLLCGLICVSLCQSIKIKPTNMYIASVSVQLKINTQVLKLIPVHSRRVVSCPVQPQACHCNCIFGTIPVAWSDRAGQLAVGGASKLNQQICISPAPERSSKLTHTGVELTPVHSRRVVSCPVQPRACHWNCVFWHNFSGVKRSC